MGPRSLARRVSGSLPGRGRARGAAPPPAHPPAAASEPAHRPIAASSPTDQDAGWFRDHFETAPGEIVSFCAEGGVYLENREIADIGCGEGIMACGLAQRVGARRVVGFDVVPTDVGKLLERMRAENVGESLPRGVEFRQSSATKIPAPDGSFDFAYSWSAFEHIEDPFSVLREIRRILRPDGLFFLQLLPFYLSAKGSHLWDWFPEEHHHLKMGDEEILARMRSSDRHPRDWTEYMASEFEHLNRVTLAELQRLILAAGLEVHRLELLTAPVQLTAELGRYLWSDLAISGVKLIALPLR